MKPQIAAVMCQAVDFSSEIFMVDNFFFFVHFFLTHFVLWSILCFHSSLQILSHLYFCFCLEKKLHTFWANDEALWWSYQLQSYSYHFDHNYHQHKNILRIVSDFLCSKCNSYLDADDKCHALSRQPLCQQRQVKELKKSLVPLCNFIFWVLNWHTDMNSFMLLTLIQMFFQRYAVLKSAKATFPKFLAVVFVYTELASHESSNDLVLHQLT